MDNYIVYKITFEDGFAYVGYTKYTIEDRIRRHIQKPDNAELAKRLLNQYYQTEILHENVAKSDVYEVEMAEIVKLKNPINIKGVKAKIKDFGNASTQETLRNKERKHRKKRNVFLPREGNFVCSICREKKTHTAFHKDRSRFNGLNSRCKVCYRLLQYYGLQEATRIALANKQALENGLFVILSKYNGRTGLRDFHILENESEQR